MPPKPFPLPFGVGTDIASIARVKRFTQHHELLYAFLRRTTSRLEFQYIRWQLLRTLASLKSNDIQNHGKTDTDFLLGILGKELLESPYALPRISSVAVQAERQSNTHDSQQAIHSLSSKLASRWAAKEAVMKASNRPLSFSQISIINPSLQAVSSSLDLPQSPYPYALVDPPARFILIPRDLVEQRGLSCASTEKLDSRKSSIVTRDSKEYYRRQLRVEENERQTVAVSLSHETEFATACAIFPHTYGAQASPSENTSSEPVIDDGEGPPRHEPNWNDRGWSDISLGNLISQLQPELVRPQI